jgi:probable rRNA maturation factor
MQIKQMMSSTGQDEKEEDPDPQWRGATGPELTLSRAVPNLEISATDQAWLEAHIAAAARHLGLTRGELSVVLVDDGTMAVMHAEYSGVEGTTDVLTFDNRDDADNHDATAVFGDIAICTDVAARVVDELHASDTAAHGVREELLLYAIHGMLHLIGEDDTTQQAFDAMHRREDEVAVAIGVGPLFGDRDAARLAKFVDPSHDAADRSDDGGKTDVIEKLGPLGGGSIEGTDLEGLLPPEAFP